MSQRKRCRDKTPVLRGSFNRDWWQPTGGQDTISSWVECASTVHSDPPKSIRMSWWLSVSLAIKSWSSLMFPPCSLVFSRLVSYGDLWLVSAVPEFSPGLFSSWVSLMLVPFLYFSCDGKLVQLLILHGVCMHFSCMLVWLSSKMCAVPCLWS